MITDAPTTNKQSAAGNCARMANRVKTIRGNQVLFMTKKLSKAIMNKPSLRSKYLKWSSIENVLAYKKVINVILSIKN